MWRNVERGITVTVKVFPHPSNPLSQFFLQKITRFRKKVFLQKMTRFFCKSPEEVFYSRQKGFLYRKPKSKFLQIRSSTEDQKTPSNKKVLLFQMGSFKQEDFLLQKWFFIKNKREMEELFIAPKWQKSSSIRY